MNLRYLFLLSIFTIGFFITGCIFLYLSVRNILITKIVCKNQSVSNAIIITVSENAKGVETATYFRVENDNNLHRVNIIRVFSRNTPKPMQIVKVRYSENGKLWVIDEYVNEIYLVYIFRIVVSVVLLFISIFAIFKEIKCQ
jgi:hypothetical protein